MTVRLLIGDCREVLRTLPAESVHCVVTSPPYFGLRDYGVAGQIGLEPTPDAYVAEMVAVFREVRRVLRKDGTCWLNLGDSYATNGIPNNRNGGGATGLKRDGRDEDSRLRSAAKTKTLGMSLPPIETGLKPKDLIGIPWRVAFALQADGWWLRQDIIWAKPNPMPESVTDRCTKAHEYLFLLTRSATYWYDAEAIREDAVYGENRYTFRGGGVYTNNQSFDNSSVVRPDADGVRLETTRRNKRSVWTVPSAPFSEAHFATFPPALIEPCIKAGCPQDGVVLDPFGGAGTTGLVADRLGRNAILVELNASYAEMGRNRIVDDGPLFAQLEMAL